MKMLHTNSVHTLLVLFTFILLASSCSKKSDPDPLDQYVGSWAETTLNGKADTGDKVTISKSGTTLTLTDFTPSGSFTASLSGSGFQADSKNIATGFLYTFPDKSQAQFYLQNLSGSLSGGNLTLTFTLYAQSSTMNVKADNVEVFAKK